jgi:hypothetical protein
MLGECRERAQTFDLGAPLHRRHAVVERDAGADVGALPRVLERVEERDGAYEVGREPQP